MIKTCRGIFGRNVKAQLLSLNAKLLSLLSSSETLSLPAFPLLFRTKISAIPFDSELAADDSCQLQQEPSARFGEVRITMGNSTFETEIGAMQHNSQHNFAIDETREFH